MSETTKNSSLEGMTDRNGNEIKFLDIHRAFAETPMGKALDTKPRYDRYKPESIPPPEWERLLGRDVNNLKHMPLTFELAQSFVKNMTTTDTPTDGSDVRFSASEIQIILLTAIVHDWAEADPSLGDISYDLKLDEHEKKESQILILMLRNQLGGILSLETLDTVHKTATDKTGKLGEAFNAIERIGYLKTALKAWQEQEVDNPYRSTDSDSLAWLCSNVLANQIPALLKLLPRYEGVRRALDASSPIINRAFENITDSIFNHYPEADREAQRKKYLDAKKAWDSFRNQQPKS